MAKGSGIRIARARAIRPQRSGPSGPAAVGGGQAPDEPSVTVAAMSEIVERPAAAGVIDALDTATRAIAGLKSVDEVLQIIVDQIRPLVGARYAALGIVGAGGAIERFITSGITQEQRALIGDPPRGHGFLGLI